MGKKLFLSFFVLAAASATFSSPRNAHTAGVVALPRTGQTKCWNTAGEEVNCQTAEGLGQDGDKQAGVAWPSPRFTDHLDGTVTDNLTGLMWLKNANCLGTTYPGFDTDGTAGDGAVLWQHALDFVAGINGGTYPDCRAGRTDWRLPNRVELASLVDRSRWNPALPEGAPFVHVRADGPSTAYWSSSTVSTAGADFAWVVYSWDGLISSNNKTADPAGVVPFVWPVRGTSDGPAQLPRTGQTTTYSPGDDGALQKGAAWPSPRFSDHGNGTVTDNLTGLIWLQDGTCVQGAGTSNWANALTFVNSLQSGQCGLTDGSSAGQWRLPNVNEMQSLAHTGMWEIGNWLNTQGFTGVERGWYWTSTTFPGDAKKLWDMNFIDGHIQDGPIDKSYGSDYVWAVRGGPGAGLATVATSPVTGVTKTTASGGGNVTSDGGTPVTARGVCWSTAASPAISDICANSGTGTGIFSAPITGLTENTTYHVRAYATNSAGTSYGEDLQFRSGHDAPFAYITNMLDNTVSVIDTATNTPVDTPIPVGSAPTGVAVNPAGTRVYVANLTGDTVSVIDAVANTVIGSAIPVGDGPRGIAVNPAGTRVYVANQNSDTVSVIDTATGGVASPVTVGDFPWGMAVNPAGTRVYVTNWLGDSVSVIDTATNAVVGSAIPVGDAPRGIAANPAGTRVYVANNNGDTVSIIDTATNTVVGSPVTVGDGPYGIAVNPAGTRVYVTNNNSDTVSVIDTATNTVTGAPIAVGDSPVGIAFIPDGTRAYVANYNSNTLSVIDTATNTVIGSPIAVGSSPLAFGRFIQSQSIPHLTVTTAAVTGITRTTATGGGNVTSDGGAAVTARGVCWGTSANPTIAGSHTTNGSGIGSFTSAIGGLSPYTTYHVRAYATNAGGTGYGDDLYFTTLCPGYAAYRGTTGYDTLQGAINGVVGAAEIRAVTGLRPEVLNISGNRIIALLGGYDCVCGEIIGMTTVQGSLTVGGSAAVTLDNMAVY